MEHTWPKAKIMGLIVLSMAVWVCGTIFAQSALEQVIPEMVLVKAGSFTMGDQIGDLHERNRPAHEVTLTYDFFIGKYEVTFEEYDAFCDATGYFVPDDEGWGRGRQPVIIVDWWDTIEFCNWLSEEEGLSRAYDYSGNLLDSDGKITNDITRVEGYRLLTEAEWEYAAKGGHLSESDYRFAGSDLLDEVAWHVANAEGKPQLVGQKKPNELGIYDMSGNVWEWCHDWFDEFYYRLEAPKINPVGPETGFVRAIRGGNWGYPANYCRVSYRDYRRPAVSGIVAGFRIARTLISP